MKAHPGDHIILAASHVDQATRDGEVLEVRGDDGAPPYLVRWSDGRTGLLFPGPGSILRVTTEQGHDTNKTAGELAGTPRASADRVGAGMVKPGLGHVREWKVRVSIFESEDDTSANVVLLSDSPTHLTAHGESHRAGRDTLVPEIGDEVAVARALRHLADKLLETAARDIEAVTGEDAVVLPLD